LTSTTTIPATTRRPGLALAAIALASILFPVSIAGASVALPNIAASLHAGLTSAQWVVNGYDLTFAAFMLASGSLADVIGRRRMFVIGTATFGGASAICAVSPNILILDLARAVAGIGAAAALTSGSASLAHVFEGPARARAFGVFGTAVGCGLAFGPTICGALDSNFGWRSVFVVPAVVGLFVAAASMVVVPESRNPQGGRVDFAGTVTFTGSLFAIILGLIEGPQIGWGSTLVVTCFVLAALLMAAFVVVEKRQSRPMFDLSLLAQRRFASLCLAVVALVFAFTPLLVYLPSYYIAVDGLSAQDVGVKLMMLTVPTLILPLVTGYLTRWLSVRLLVLSTVVFSGLGVGWLTVIGPGASNWVVLGPYLCLGIGIGVCFGVMDGAAVSSVEPGRAGMAAGMYNTMRLGGEAIGIALVGTLLAGITGANLAGRITGFNTPYASHPQTVANLVNQGNMAGALRSVNPPAARGAFQSVLSDAYTGALHVTLWSLAGLCLVIVLLLAVLDRPAKPAEASAVALDEDMATEPLPAG
jgi:EmrB/QacA subfamily drug resistance transporter